MSSFFQLFLAWGVLLLVILVLYLVDKINIIYQRQSQDATEPVYSDGLFGELQRWPVWGVGGQSLVGRHERYSLARF